LRRKICKRSGGGCAPGRRSFGSRDLDPSGLLKTNAREVGPAMNDIRPTRFQGAQALTLAADVGGDPAGPPVMLLHGGGQTRHSWRGTMQSLMAEGYFVVNLDARGHGDSDWAADGNYSLDDLADDLDAVIATLAGKPTLVGASMGGVTALTLIGRKPEVAAALVLVDIVPHMNLEGTDRIRVFMQKHTGGFASLDEAAAAVSEYNPHRRSRTNTGLLKNLRLRADGRFYWHWDPRLLAGIEDDNPAERIELLDRAARSARMPALLVRGLQSDVVTDEGAAQLRSEMPHLEVFDVADASHMVAGDENDAFARAVIEFLNRHRNASTYTDRAAERSAP
jgi:pimeloyl-ACP methyl ester carboxylesterase